MTLTGFLLARLDEEMLVKWAASIRRRVDTGLPDDALRDLAALYADHPDYRAEWW